MEELQGKKSRQMPTIAFALEQGYIDKLEEKIKELRTNKSEYLRRIVKASLDDNLPKAEEDKHV